MIQTSDLNIRKKESVFLKFKYNVWAADLAEMGLLSFNHDTKYSLCAGYFHQMCVG